MKKRWIPFGWMPGHWGLAGETRERAKIEYYYSGTELKKQLARLGKHNSEADLAELQICFEAGELIQQEYDKKVANIKKEPWVTVVKIEMDPASGNVRFVELDWNEEFVKFLHSKNYRGRSDSEIVNRWFNDLCRTVIIAEANDQDYGLEPNDEDKE
jgi:hypothetical protein